ncbi:hypothetical protein GMRT_13804 [Giardia muris]|uniref:Uncharacterized protein n=1 Tax=Giardia muris TaxID=5742 RepID=A0A4Z1SUU7_GIAMU|nr:hypothetical protein GMRT_13804 [Giardia muris]|eukprot:TNJ28725.1 hypothetical protein GMRT_13804 [Giardia muris]
MGTRLRLEARLRAEDELAALRTILSRACGHGRAHVPLAAILIEYGTFMRERGIREGGEHFIYERVLELGAIATRPVGTSGTYTQRSLSPAMWEARYQEVLRLAALRHCALLYWREMLQRRALEGLYREIQRRICENSSLILKPDARRRSQSSSHSVTDSESDPNTPTEPILPLGPSGSLSVTDIVRQLCSENPNLYRLSDTTGDPVCSSNLVGERDTEDMVCALLYGRDAMDGLAAARVLNAGATGVSAIYTGRAGPHSGSSGVLDEPPSVTDRRSSVLSAVNLLNHVGKNPNDEKLLEAVVSAVGLYTCKDFLGSQAFLSASQADAMSTRETQLRALEERQVFLGRLRIKRLVFSAIRTKYLHLCDCERQIFRTSRSADWLLVRALRAWNAALRRQERTYPICIAFRHAADRWSVTKAFQAWRAATNMLTPIRILSGMPENGYRGPEETLINQRFTDSSLLSSLGLSTRDLEQRRKNREFTRIRCTVRLASYIPSLRNAHAALFNKNVRTLFSGYQAMLEAARDEAPHSSPIEHENIAVNRFVRGMLVARPDVMGSVIPLSFPSLRRNVDYIRFIRAAATYQSRYLRIFIDMLRANVEKVHRARHLIHLKLEFNILRMQIQAEARMLQQIENAERYYIVVVRRLAFHALQKTYALTQAERDFRTWHDHRLLQTTFLALRSVFLPRYTASRQCEVVLHRHENVVLRRAFFSWAGLLHRFYHLEHVELRAVRNTHLIRWAFSVIRAALDRGQRIRQCASLHRINILRQAFMGLRLRDKTLQAVAAVVRCIPQNWDLRLLKVAYCSWRERASALKEKFLLIQEKTIGWEQHLLRSVLLAWWDAWKLYKARITQLEATSVHRIKSFAYSTLRSCYSDIKNADELYRTTEARRLVFRQRQLILCWRDTVINRIKKRYLAERALRAARERRICLVAFETIRMTYFLAVLRTLGQLTTKRAAFSAWRKAWTEVIDEARLEERLALRQQTFPTNVLARLRENLSTALVAYSDTEQKYCQWLHANVSDREFTMLSIYLRLWSMNARECVHQRRIIDMIQRRINARLLREVWADINAFATHMRHCEQIIYRRTTYRRKEAALSALRYATFLLRRAKAMGHLRQRRLLNICFTSLLSRHRKIVELTGRVSRNADVHRLRVYFHELRSLSFMNMAAYAVEARVAARIRKETLSLWRKAQHMKHAESRLVAIVRYRTLEASFVALVEQNRAIHQEREASWRADSHAHEILLRRAWDAWSRRASTLAIAEKKVFEAHASRILKWAFQAIYKRKSDLIFNEQITYGAIYTLKLSRIIGVWRTAANSARMAAAASVARSLRLSWMAWRRALRGACDRQALLEIASQRRKVQQVRSCLLQWNERTVMLQGAERSIIAGRESRLLQDGFNTIWRAYLLSKAEKYVSKRLVFHAWHSTVSGTRAHRTALLRQAQIKRKSDILAGIYLRGILMRAWAAMRERHANVQRKIALAEGFSRTSLIRRAFRALFHSSQ